MTQLNILRKRPPGNSALKIAHAQAAVSQAQKKDGTLDEFYKQLAEVLEVADVAPTDVLQRFDSWDSLTVLSIISLVDSRFGVRMSGDDLKEIQTVADLERAIASKKLRP